MREEEGEEEKEKTVVTMIKVSDKRNEKGIIKMINIIKRGGEGEDKEKWRRELYEGNNEEAELTKDNQKKVAEEIRGKSK